VRVDGRDLDFLSTDGALRDLVSCWVKLVSSIQVVVGLRHVPNSSCAVKILRLGLSASKESSSCFVLLRLCILLGVEFLFAFVRRDGVEGPTTDSNISMSESLWPSGVILRFLLGRSL